VLFSFIKPFYLGRFPLTTKIKWLDEGKQHLEDIYPNKMAYLKQKHFGEIHPYKMAYLKEKHFMVTSTQIKWLR
jgi:hypothetical protein